MTPARAVILAIDPGKRSGWCMRNPPTLPAHIPSAGAGTLPVYSGAATSIEGRELALSLAMADAVRFKLPLVVVAESWSRHGKWGHAQQAGTSAEWGKWLAAIEMVGVDELPKLGRASMYRGVVRVDSTAWHVALGGSRRNPREVRLRMAMARSKCSDPDEACARCISEWASLAPEVDAVLPAAFRRAT